MLASPAAEQPPRDEYEVNAAALQKFAMFVEWPASATATNPAPFVIGILGDDPFKEKLEKVLSSQRVHGKPLGFRRFANVQEVVKTNCQLLFIASSEANRLASILKELQDRPILTVGNTDGYCASGVMINLGVKNQGTLLFEINKDTAADAGLNISSQLLELAAKRYKRPKAISK